MYAHDTSLLLSETLVVLGEAEDRFVHSVLWSLGSPHSPLSHKIYGTRCQNSTNECLLSFCLLFLNGNIFKIWSKKIWVFQASPSFPLFFNCVVPPLCLWQDVRYKMSPRDVKTPYCSPIFHGSFCLPCIAAEDHSTLTGFAITDNTSCMEFRQYSAKMYRISRICQQQNLTKCVPFLLGSFLVCFASFAAGKI